MFLPLLQGWTAEMSQAAKESYIIVHGSCLLVLVCIAP